MLKRFAFVALFGLIAGCGGGGGYCEQKSPCPGVPTPTQAQIDQCNAAVNGQCGAQFVNLGQCIRDLQTQQPGEQCGNCVACANTCKSQQQAFDDCCAAAPSAPGCS